MQRRTLLQILLSFAAALPARARLLAQGPSLSATDERRVRALADVVLPSEIGPQGRAAAVDGFIRWLRDYRAGVDTDHGYGFPRLRKTANSPASKYAAQLDALDAAASAKGGAFADLPVLDRRALLEAAIADARIERLPVRPDGGHVATDLMGFYFNSIEANDLCYRVAIGRDTCRALDGSSERPKPLVSNSLAIGRGER